GLGCARLELHRLLAARPDPVQLRQRQLRAASCRGAGGRGGAAHSAAAGHRARHRQSGRTAHAVDAARRLPRAGLAGGERRRCPSRGRAGEGKGLTFRTDRIAALLDAARKGHRPTDADAAALAGADDLPALTATAAMLRDRGHGRLVSYSRKVFIPLTHLCRDVCHYCTFARPPRKGERAYMTREEVLAVARAGAAAGCKEALFTLGDRPERRYRVAREELAALGYDSTLAYLRAMAEAVFTETGLLPHLNPGLMGAADYAALRPVSASMGIMLEST